MFLLKKIRNYPLSSLLIVVIWVVCLIPIPETPLSDVNLIDKWTHFVMYGSLTSVIWFEYIRRHKQPLTRHYVTPSPQGARGEVSNETSKEGYAQEIVTSSSPLGERMPEGQVRGLEGSYCLSAVSYVLLLWAVSSNLLRDISLPAALEMCMTFSAIPSVFS